MNELDRAAAELLGLEYDSNAEEVLARIPSSRQWVSWHPCTDLNQAALVVAEAIKRNPQRFYEALKTEVISKWSAEQIARAQEWEIGNAFITAPAEARVRAALEATKACDE